MSLYLIADGGGSKTEIRLIDQDGNVISQVLAAGTNPVHIGIDASVKLLEDTTRALLQKAGVSEKDVCRAAFFIPVLWRHKGVLDGLFPFPLELLSDALAVLWAALGDRDGIAVLCGTGSFACGRNSGNNAFVGGWGPTLGDEGSGFALGRAAIMHAISVYDMAEDEDSVSKIVKKHFSIEDLSALKAIQADASLFSASRIAALCPLLELAAAEGNQTVLEIIREAAGSIASQVLACARRLGISCESRFSIALTGGVIINNPVISSIYLDSLKETFPNAEITCSKKAPIEGAADYLLHKAQ